MIQRIRAAAIIVNDKKQILLVKHVHPETGHAWWVTPGGGLEDVDNSIFDCAKRETFEEANLKVKISRIVYIREFFYKKEGEINLELFTLADDWDGESNIENIANKGVDEQYIKEVKWLSKEDLKDIEVYPEILKNEFWDDYANNFPVLKYLGRQT